MCSKSLIYTVKADTIKEIPKINTYCTNKTTGYNNIYQVKPKSENKHSTNMITVDIMKFIALLVTTEIGKISLGK